MGGQRAIGIKSHLARAKQQTRIANIVHRLHLLRRHHPTHPEEAAAIGKAALQGGRVQFREDRRQLACGAGRVDQVFGLGIERMGQHIGGQNPAIAVHDVSPALRDGVRRPCAARLHRFRGGQHAHPRAHDREGREKAHAKEQQPQLRPPTGTLAQGLIALAQIVTLDGLRTAAGGAGMQDAGKRAKGCADHGLCTSGSAFRVPETSTGASMARSDTLSASAGGGG